MCDVPPIFLQEELHSLKIETKKINCHATSVMNIHELF